MHAVERTTTASPSAVWAVVADGWTYPSWVVGASRMRAVSASWPAVGARLHHSVGTWPALLDDETTVEAVEPGRWIRLQPKARPFGRATVEITVEPHGDGALVRIVEDAASGPARLAPRAVRQAAIHPRNVETLRRLTLLAERATRP